MKQRISEAFGAASIVLSLALLAGCAKSVIQTEEAVLAGSDASGSPNDWVELPPADSEAGADSNKVAAATADVEGIVTPVSLPNEGVLPPGLKRGGPFSDLVRMADSGLEESVLLSYTLTAQGTFGLGAEEIIFLKDIGVPSSVVKAMIDHDHLLTGLNPAIGENRLPEVDQINFPVASGPGGDRLPGTLQRAEYEIPRTTTEQNPVELVGDDSSPSMVEFIGEEPRSNPDFYRELAPYGSWVDVEGSGRCWKPTVAAATPGWQPYCDRGHWVLTESGWYWRSDYSWGWAAFHYGRWFHHATSGWCWRPDQVWGPAWVTWRSSAQYCGWAPLPPAARFIPGQGLSFHGAPATTTMTFGLGPTAFRFVSWSSFLSARISSHQTPTSQATRLFGDSRPATSIVCQDNRVVNTLPGVWEHLPPFQSGRPSAPSPQVVNTLPPRSRRPEIGGTMAATLSTSSPNPGSFTAPEVRDQAGLVVAGREPGTSQREREAIIRRGAPPNSLIFVGARNRASGQSANSIPTAGRNPAFPEDHLSGMPSPVAGVANSPAQRLALNENSTPWWARPTPQMEASVNNSRQSTASWNPLSSPRGHSEPAFGEPVSHHWAAAEVTTHSHPQMQENQQPTHAHTEPAVHSETHAAAAESHSSSHSSGGSSKESQSSSASSEHHGR